MDAQLEVDVEGARERHCAGAVWIDVREPGEWLLSRIEGTELHPMHGAIDAILAGWPDRATSLNIGCASGVRSMHVVVQLRAAGYTDVMNVAGGIHAWIAAGHPVLRGAVDS